MSYYIEIYYDRIIKKHNKDEILYDRVVLPHDVSDWIVWNYIDIHGKLTEDGLNKYGQIINNQSINDYLNFEYSCQKYDTDFPIGEWYRAIYGHLKINGIPVKKQKYMQRRLKHINMSGKSFETFEKYINTLNDNDKKIINQY